MIKVVIEKFKKIFVLKINGLEFFKFMLIHLVEHELYSKEDINDKQKNFGKILIIVKWDIKLKDDSTS